MDWASILKEIGVIAGIAVFLVWGTWAREQRLAARVTALEKFVETELMKVVTESVSALRDNTKALVRLADTMAERPCLMEALGDKSHGD